MSSSLRPVAAPFVAAAPAGARVRTRLRVSGHDEMVLRAVGRHLGSLAGRDLAVRCAQGRLDAGGQAGSRAARKRALTAESSSRWAGAITRTSEDQWQLALRNLRADRSGLQARISKIRARLAVPAGGRAGRVRGYATAAERHAKAVRLQVLQARLAAVDRRLAAGTVSVVRGGGGGGPAPPPAAVTPSRGRRPSGDQTAIPAAGQRRAPRRRHPVADSTWVCGGLSHGVTGG
jgi:hypothetical protein